jgi:hypothetical protein
MLPLDGTTYTATVVCSSMTYDVVRIIKASFIRMHTSCTVRLYPLCYTVRLLASEDEILITFRLLF